MYPTANSNLQHITDLADIIKGQTKDLGGISKSHRDAIERIMLQLQDISDDLDDDITLNADRAATDDMHRAILK